MAGRSQSVGAAVSFDHLEQARIFASISAGLDVAPTALEIGRYRVTGRLGAGAMGVVYSAHDPKLQRQVAIKVLQPTAGIHDALILREARSAAALRHPNVVEVFDVGQFDPTALAPCWYSASTPPQPGKRVFITMEYLAGESLRAWLRKGRPEREIVDAFRQAGLGLAAAHDRGIIHRDFKPDNVHVSEDGRVRVLDFGLARRVEARAPVDRTLPAARSALDSETTSLGPGIVGTPRFMPPEQMRGEAVDGRADQYAFCVALLVALGGSSPFTGTSMPSLLQSKEQGVGRLGPPLSPGLARAIERGLSVDREDRFPTMRSLLAAIAPARGIRGAVAVPVGAVALWVGTRALVPDRGCLDTDFRARAVRDAAAVQRSFADASPRYGAAASETFNAHLERYAEQWTAAARQACEAGPAEARDAEIICLRRQARAVEALIGAATRSADTEAVATMVGRAARLPEPNACVDDNGPPVAVNGPLRTALEHFDALWLEGDIAGAEVAAAEAVRRARVGDDEAQLADALLRRGRALIELHDPAAIDVLAEGYEAASSAGWEVGAIDAVLELARAHADGNRDAEPAFRWIRLGEALLDRRPNDLVRRARLAAVRGFALGAASRPREAEASLRESIALRRRAGRGATIDLAGLHLRLAILVDGEGRVHDADRQFDKALELGRAAVGPDHPWVAWALSQRASGGAFAQQGRHDEAIALQDRALKITERAQGPESIAAALVRNQIGLTYLRAGDGERAAEYLQRSIEIKRAIRGDDHPTVILSQANLAGALSYIGRNTQAIQVARQALAGSEARHGTESTEAARAHGILAYGLRDEGPANLALWHASRAASILRARLPAEHADLAIAANQLGVALRNAGRAAEAVVELERAVAHFDALDAAVEDVAWVRFELAQAVWAAGREAEARRSVAAVHADLAAAVPDSKSLTPMAEWLADHAVH
ncbi:MAG: serine/threonine-protein kinase [Myxococcota bacterium]